MQNREYIAGKILKDCNSHQSLMQPSFKSLWFVTIFFKNKNIAAIKSGILYQKKNKKNECQFFIKNEFLIYLEP